MMWLGVLIIVATLSGSAGSEVCLPIESDQLLGGLQFEVTSEPSVRLDHFNSHLPDDYMLLSNGPRVVFAGTTGAEGVLVEACFVILDGSSTVRLDGLVAGSLLGEELAVEHQPGAVLLLQPPRNFEEAPE